MQPQVRIPAGELKYGVPRHLWCCRPAVFVLLAVLAVPPTSLGALLGLRLSENVHVVVPGLAYRSAQLWPDELELVIADYGIRSIISLVPPEPEQSWYQGELLVSSSHQIARYELPLSPDVRPTSDQLRDLLFLMQEAPKPILIHSRSGADRTGLAAAMFQYAIASRPAGEAGRQLSIRYGHFPSVWWDTSVMDATFQEFVDTRRPSTP